MSASAGIYAVLTSASVNGGTNIYKDAAPANTNYPYVVFNQVSGVNTVLDSDDFQQELWDVRVITDTASEAQSVGAAIRTALHDATLTVSGWTVHDCWAERDIDFIDIENEERIYKRGFTFRIRMSATR